MSLQTVENNNAMPSGNYSHLKKNKREKWFNKGSHEESNPVNQIENHGS